MGVAVTVLDRNSATNRSDNDASLFNDPNAARSLSEQRAVKIGEFFRLTVSTPDNASYGWQLQSIATDMEFQ